MQRDGLYHRLPPKPHSISCASLQPFPLTSSAPLNFQRTPHQRQQIAAATNNPLLGGLAAFGIGTVHALTTNALTDNGVTHNPHLARTMRQEFPRNSEFLISAIPGLQPPETQPSRMQRTLDHVRHSPFSYANHTAMIAIAGTAGLDRDERRRCRSPGRSNRSVPHMLMPASLHNEAIDRHRYNEGHCQ